MQDGKITELFLSRDSSALLEAQKAYGRYCMKLALNVLGNKEDAEECVNDALHKVWNAIPPANPMHFGAFLARVTRNTALDRRKHNARQMRKLPEAEAVLSELSELVSGSEDPEEAAMERDLREAINAFLMTLPERKRRIFIARYFRYESIVRIAKENAVSPGSVKTELFRIRTDLKNYLTERSFII